MNGNKITFWRRKFLSFIYEKKIRGNGIYIHKMHNGRNPLNWGRNIETIIGNRVAGRGQPYEINIYGSAKLTPFLPWIK